MKKTSLLAAGALAASSIVAFSGAPAGATSKQLDYSCNMGLLGTQTMKVVSDTNAPAQQLVGQATSPLKLTSDVDVPQSVVGALIGGLGAASGSGTVVANSAMRLPDGTTTALSPVTMTIPNTVLPTTGDLILKASGTGSPFTPPAVGNYTILARDFTATLTLLNSSGVPVVTDLAVPCTTPTGTNLSIDTIKAVVPSTTTLTVQRTSEAYGQATSATAKVTSDSPLASGMDTPAGTVRFTIGGKSVSAPLDSTGTATVTKLPTVPAGRTYNVVAHYSSAATSFYQSTNSTATALKVVKDGTRTTVAAPNIRRHHAEVATVKVTSTHRATVTGKVKAILKKGTRTLMTKTVRLRSGKAAVNFGKLSKKGTYTVVAKYLGTGNFKVSSGRDGFSVR